MTALQSTKNFMIKQGIESWGMLTRHLWNALQIGPTLLSLLSV